MLTSQSPQSIREHFAYSLDGLSLEVVAIEGVAYITVEGGKLVVGAGVNKGGVLLVEPLVEAMVVYALERALRVRGDYLDTSRRQGGAQGIRRSSSTLSARLPLLREGRKDARSLSFKL